LLVVSQSGVPTVTANENIVRMIQRLKSGKALDEKEWAAEREDRDVAKTILQSIKNVSNIDEIQNFWLRDKLSKIKRANDDKVIRIDNELKSTAPNEEELSKNLDELYSILRDISAAVGDEVSILQVDVKSLSDWANGAAGGKPVT
jgi:hypothetical protein